MLIDIHRHSAEAGKADRLMRNLFHNQQQEIEPKGIYSVGLHPWHVSENELYENLQQVRDIAQSVQVIAIGEAGLDKTVETPIDIQQKAFEKQIEIAQQVNKPMVIHCVRAYNEILQLRKSSKHTQPWIIHWFNASVEMGNQLIEAGFYLSFGLMLFNENSKAFKAFTKFPVDRIFFETDDSEYTIEEVYHRAALLRNCDRFELERQIEANFEACFGIKDNLII